MRPKALFTTSWLQVSTIQRETQVVSVEQAVCGEVWLGDGGWFGKKPSFTLALWRGSVSSGCASALQATHILTQLLIQFELPPSHVDSHNKESCQGKLVMLRLLTSCLQRMNDTLVSTTMSATYAVDKLLTSGMITAMLSQTATIERGLHLNSGPSPKTSPCWSFL